MICVEFVRPDVTYNSHQFIEIWNWARRKMRLPCHSSRMTIKRIIYEYSESLAKHHRQIITVISQYIQDFVSDWVCDVHENKYL